MKNFIQLKNNFKKDYSNLKKIRVSLLGDSATQFLVYALRGMGYEYGYDLEIWESDFGQIDRQIFDSTSKFYTVQHDVVIVFQSSQKLLEKYNKRPIERLKSFAVEEMETIKKIYTCIAKKTNAKVIFYNFLEIDDAVFGNFANKVEQSFLFQLRKLNFELMGYASEEKDFYLCDMSSIQNQISRSSIFQSSIYVNTEMVLSLEALPFVAKRTVDIIAAVKGQFKKCLILDLDNTIWGGVIGDDGIENIEIGSLGIGKVFSEFQYWIRKLKERGIILAVCSKNNEAVAKEPFEKHPDMILKLDDIAVFMANWDNKVDNICQIQQILNIGFDSMVFMDDNPFERNMVRENIPDICVPELPNDPAEYLEYLYALNLFETVSYSAEEGQRTKQYQVEAKRVDVKKTFANEESFLESLGMISSIEPFNKFNIPRIAQLSQRSNQFNLRTIRYSEADIVKLVQLDDYFTFAFSLKDKFGDNGLICVIILNEEANKELFIDTWFMSCRVLNRGMTSFVLNAIVDFAKQNNFMVLKGEYVPTAKNDMVKDHYLNLGFRKEENYWVLDVSNYQEKKNYITKG